MKTKLLYFTCLLLLLTCAQAQTVAPAPAQRASIAEGYGRLPLAFEANQGQTDPQVKFVSRGAGYNLFLTTTEAVLTLHRASRQEPNSPAVRAAPPREEKSAVLRMKLVGANAKTEVSGQNELPSKSNYFIGNDLKKWHANVRQYARVRYANVYPGVDLVYYGNQRELEYDFVLQPGARPEAIRLAIEGASKLRLEHGDLVLSSAGGDVRLRCPRSYQEVNGTKQEIRGHYVMKKNEVGFQVASYDRRRALVIDPVLAYSTYLGGSGDDDPFAITIDLAGNAYVTGTTSSLDFPTANALQPANHGGGDVFVTKISPDGTGLVYSTYLGGSSVEIGRSIAVDSTGIYVTGVTLSFDFPTFNPFQPTLHGAVNAFVTKINAAGNALVYSTYLGGSNYDDAWGIAVDAVGNAHVRGDTRSTDFPVKNAIQPHLRARVFNCFVSEFTADGSALVYSTYWGGSQGEGGVGIAVDSVGNTYVGGYTFSPDFPTVNPIQSTLAGEQDTFVTKFSADGQTVIYSTYLGGTGDERGEDFTADSSGNTYIVGYTTSTDFPMVNAIQPTNAGNIDAFAVKINAAGNALVYSTYLGGSGEDEATGIATDSAGNAYVVGYTTSTNFPIAQATQTVNHGGRDAFVTKISPDGGKLLYSTYMGGSSNENYWRDTNVAADSAGNAYVAGITWSTDFPVTAGAFQKSLKGGSDSFVVKVAIGGSLTTLASSLNPSIYGQKVTWTATVAPSGAIPPTGTVSFTWGSAYRRYTIGTATLNSSGVATLTRSNLNAYLYPLTAVYKGDANNPGSTSAVLNQIVTQTTSAATITSSLNPSTLGQAVTFTATITSPTVTPTGPVTFTAGNTVLGTTQLAGGKAKLTTSTLAVGSTKVKATYYGNSNISKSSASVTQTVH